MLQTINVIDREALAQKEIDNEFYINNLYHLPIPVIVGLIAALAVIVSGVTTAFLKNKSDIEIDIGKALREKRIEVYSKLFSYMETFAVFKSLNTKLKNDELVQYIWRDSMGEQQQQAEMVVGGNTNVFLGNRRP